MRERDFRAQMWIKIGRKYLIKKVEGVFKFPFIGSFVILSEHKTEVECTDICKEFVKIRYLVNGGFANFVNSITSYAEEWVDRDSIYVIGEIQISDKSVEKGSDVKPDMKIKTKDLFSKDINEVISKLNEIVDAFKKEEDK